MGGTQSTVYINTILTSAGSCRFLDIPVPLGLFRDKPAIGRAIRASCHTVDSFPCRPPESVTDAK